MSLRLSYLSISYRLYGAKPCREPLVPDLCCSCSSGILGNPCQYKQGNAAANEGGNAPVQEDGERLTEPKKWTDQQKGRRTDRTDTAVAANTLENSSDCVIWTIGVWWCSWRWDLPLGP